MRLLSLHSSLRFLFSLFVVSLFVIPRVFAWQERTTEQQFAVVDSIIQNAIVRGEIPGAVLLISHGDERVYRKAYGHAQLYDYGMKRLNKPEDMTADHFFDLASMTKVLATTMGIMILVNKDFVNLDAPVYRYLPEFRSPSKDSITIRHLLTHSSGLYQWQPMYLYASEKEGVLKRICDLPLQFPVGQQRRYSDLGFMLLGYIIEKVSGRLLDQFLKDQLYGPVALRSATFNPLEHGIDKNRIAATSHGNPYEYHMIADTAFGYRVIGDPDPSIFKRWRHYTLKGEANDGNAFYAHKGIAGHAGLFSTAEDINVLFRLMLHGGTYQGKKIFRKQVVDQFLSRNEFGHGLGWQLTNLADSVEAPVIGFGHGGFTGTYAICIPEHRLVIILLTNRGNMGTNENGYYNDLRFLQRSVFRAILSLVKR